MTHQKISASGLVVDQSGKVLMVKRADNDTFLPGVYELPGGGTDFNEDPTEGLKREIREETGLEVNVDHPLTAFSFMMEHEGVEKHTVEIIYLCQFLGDQQVKLSFEHSDYRWINFDELITLETTDFMRDLILGLKEHPVLKTNSLIN
jgi:8-oxo-dGTP diphosphatase